MALLAETKGHYSVWLAPPVTGHLRSATPSKGTG